MRNAIARCITCTGVHHKEVRRLGHIHEPKCGVLGTTPAAQETITKTRQPFWVTPAAALHVATRGPARRLSRGLSYLFGTTCRPAALPLATLLLSRVLHHSAESTPGTPSSVLMSSTGERRGGASTEPLDDFAAFVEPSSAMRGRSNSRVSGRPIQTRSRVVSCLGRVVVSMASRARFCAAVRALGLPSLCLFVSISSIAAQRAAAALRLAL